MQLSYYEDFINKKDAKKREKFLKSGSGLRFLKKQLSDTINITSYVVKNLSRD